MINQVHLEIKELLAKFELILTVDEKTILNHLLHQIQINQISSDMIKLIDEDNKVNIFINF